MTVYAVKIVLLLLGAVGLIFVIHGNFGAIFVGILLVILETYFLVIIRAHYYEIKRQNGAVQSGQNLEALPHPGP